MNKLLMAGILFVGAASVAAPQSGGEAAVESAILVTLSPLLTAGTVTKLVVGTSVLVMDESSGGIRKEVVIAAVEDAAVFKSMNGEVEKTPALIAAMDEIDKIQGSDELSEIEKAEAVILLGDSFQQ